MLIFFYILSFILSSSYSDNIYGKNYSTKSLGYAEYVDNYDGDTVTVNLPKLPDIFGKGIKIRIKGIDTAEIKSKNSCEKKIALYTRNYVRNLLINANKIEVKNPTRGKYFRIIADLWFDGTNLKDILLTESLAVLYDGKTRKEHNWCMRLKTLN